VPVTVLGCVMDMASIKPGEGREEEAIMHGRLWK
jgi:hypothetical protein